jgi:exodeoxyribonuclease V alpha subunit
MPFKIETVIKIVTYYDENSGYCVLKDDLQRAFVGHLMFHPKHIVGIPVVIECNKSKGKYGIQYKFNSIQHDIPPLFYFLTGVIKGVQKNAALKLAEKYKNIGTLERALNNNEKDILKVKGIGKKSLEKLKNGLKHEKELYLLSELLLPYGISAFIVRKLYENYKKDKSSVSLIKEIKEEPYKVLTSVRGIGFKKADEIAVKSGIVKKDSIKRAKAAIEYIFYQITDNDGETAVYKKDIRDSFFEIFENDVFDEENFEKAFSELKKEGKLIEMEGGKGVLYTVIAIKKTEEYIYERIKKESNVFSFLSKGQELTADFFIKEYEKENGIKLDEVQKKAIIDFLTEKSFIYIIAGYAGTGKTTTSKGIVEFLKARDKKIVGCALSGTAANRLKSVSGIESYTIHSLLGYRRSKNGDFEFKHNEKNPLDYDLIILDEASMVNSYLFFHLLKAIDGKKTKLLLLGDDAQLPPIGWGEPFVNLLEWENVPKTKLEKIYRQSGDKVITLFANDIRKGNVPSDYKKSFYKDFKFVSFNVPYSVRNLPKEEKRAIREENNLAIRSYILEGYEKSAKDILSEIEKYKKEGGTEHLKNYIQRIQFITAVKNGPLGTNEMNIRIKNILNKVDNSAVENRDYITFKNRNGILKKFSLYDKVIHLQNQNMPCSPHQIKSNLIPDIIRSGSFVEEERVYNGQVGIITAIASDEENVYVEVCYPNENYYAYYYKEDFEYETVDLAYSITIHKSQGQEYSSVIMPITFSHFMNLNSKLLYTAVTRAKDKITIVGEDGAFAVACKKLEEIKRKTVLSILSKRNEKGKGPVEKNVEKNKRENDEIPF